MKFCKLRIKNDKVGIGRFWREFMHNNSPRLLEATFSGKDYKVQFRVRDVSYKQTVRDTMGDDVCEWRTQWEGWVTVRDEKKQCVAACNLGIHHGYGYETIHQRIHLAGLAPGMEEAYADFLAKKVIAAFNKGEGEGVPIFTLIYRFDDWKMERAYHDANRQELLEAGLILDEHGQRTLALK